ncbi:DNA-binding NarL/FixJ family response regulator [Devosia subaequoris]|uniref:DNA-binding NarL/FixJ family response regulator n=1 Tax=Devosia subaequoris TaxID=395930 RepID=A0A7W6NCI2_9HYPH|nr:DNA-binding NarL/FixJ family response regulator [Devosia subaequoris]MCP1210382.1 response regulator transcription factor [Devosia subaequoris]
MRENLYDGLPNPRQTEDRPFKSGTLRLVFVAPQQAIYQCLSSALQDHFRDADVFLVDRIDDTSDPDHSVGLVLLGAGARLIGVEFIEQCSRRFPNAAIAVATDNGVPVVDPQLTERRLIQGILPTSLPLDVWFALMRLVMAGGEYLPHGDSAPAGHFEPLHRSSRGAPLTSASPAPPGGQKQAAEIPLQQNHQVSNGAENGLDTLTAREREILTLVSEGYQNKLIANRMALSEHTVKAHVHNLIAKLRVTNRTQAAAYLHEHGLDKSARSTGSLSKSSLHAGAGDHSPAPGLG